MNKFKRAAAFLSALVMLAAVTPELPVKILNESYSITASAEDTVNHFSNVSIRDITFYESGCLKSFKLSMTTKQSYGEASGKVAIHTSNDIGLMPGGKYAKDHIITSWEVATELKDCGFVTWADGDTFCWTGNVGKVGESGFVSTVDVIFKDKTEDESHAVDMSKDCDYYAYLWTLANGKVYPDDYLYHFSIKNGNLQTQDGKTYDSTGRELSNPSYTAPTAVTGLTYDGDEHEVLNAGTVSEGGTMKYSLDNVAWTDTVPKIKNAGTYNVYYKVEASEGYTDVSSTVVSVKISPKSATITADNKSRPVNQENPEFTYTQSGVLEKDLNSIGTVTYTCSATKESAAGTYDITPGITSPNTNYSFSYVNGTLTVNPQITVTLNANGGTVSQNSLTFEPGTSIILPTPTRTGYIFNGWYNGDTRVNTTETFNQSTTLTAKWTPRIYTITLDDCGGTGGTGSYKSAYNNVLKSSVNVPELDGYTFAGYFSKQDGQGTQYYNENGKLVYYYSTSGNTTVYAYWVPAEYSVTLELNGGTLAENSSELTYTYGTGAELPTDAEKTGYVFAGWYSNSEFTGSPVTVIPETASGDKTFYAKWEPNRHSVNVNAVLESGGLIAENLKGNGIYSYGDTVSVSALHLLAYDFKGWYKSDGKDGFAGNILSENPEYSFELMDENVSVTAVYAQKSTDDRLQLEVNGMAFKINGGKTQYGHCVLKYNAGTEITIEYIDKTQNFYYWKNETGKIVSQNKKVTFVMVSDTVMTANSIADSNEDSTAVVEFISDTDQVLEAYSYSETDTIAFPKGPSKFGYEFTGWNKTNAEIQKEIADGLVRVVVTPVYKDVRQKYTVTVAYPDGTIADDVYENQIQGSGVSFTAKDISGRTFAYWSADAQGKKILGYNPNYFMKVNGDETVYAIYTDKAVEKKPTIIMTDKYASTADGKNKVSFSATRDVNEKYTVVEQGILRNTDSSLTADTFVIDAINVKKIRSTDTGRQGVFTLNVSVGSSVNTVVYSRGYMVLKNIQTGMSEIVYSDEIYSGSYNSLK